jgi:hypothetical protein
MPIIAAVNAKIAVFILIAALIFTPRKIAGIWFCPLPQDTIEVGVKCRTGPLFQSPIVDSFQERKVTKLLIAQIKAA